MLQPTVDELARRGTPFVGLLYAGLALTSRGVRVIEFNARFGDPETQPLLARLITPLGGLLYAAATGDLGCAAGAGVEQRSRGRLSCWPRRTIRGRRVTGGVINGLEQHRRNGSVVVHAGTARRPEGRLISAGGRVLAVVGHRRGSRPGSRHGRTRGSPRSSSTAPSTAPTSPAGCRRALAES